MAKEHEIDILGVDKTEAIGRLKALGAAYSGHLRYRRMEFTIGGRIGGQHSWARVRTDGKKTTITVKKLISRHLPMEEHEVFTDNFDDAVRLMARLARSKPIFFENERDTYRLDGATITLDKWPMIPYFMEIESSSMAHAKSVYRKLGIRGEMVGNATMDSIFKRYGMNFRKEMAKHDGKLRRILDG